MKSNYCILLLLGAALWGCRKNGDAGESTEASADKMTIQVSSPAFRDGSMIPSKYTADGQNISPPLEWKDVPAGTESIALVCDDPDAPMATWVHWVMWNIPPDSHGLKENIRPDRTLPDGAEQGFSDFKSTGYGGPAPPNGTHRYYFKIYALDTALNLPDDTTKADLLKAIKGHIIAEGQLMGRYKRQ